MKLHVVVVGLGYIGLPTAATLANAGLQVTGVDVNAQVVDTINRGEIHISEQGLDILVRAAVQRQGLRAAQQVPLADIYIIAVPTPITTDKKPDLGFVISATKAICSVLKAGDLVILESTVPPGTCVNVVGPLIAELTGLSHRHDYLLAHCPERVIPGKILQEIIYNDRIIGGTTKSATERTADLYLHFVKGRLLKTDATTAELCKLMENTYRDVNIALANELAGIAESLNVDIEQAIMLANHHPRVYLHSPSIGVGGHCIPVDPWFIVHVQPDRSQLIHTARQINDARPTLYAQRILDYLETTSEPVALLGLSYKADVDDLRESPAVEIVKHIAERWHKKLYVVEPHIESLPTDLLGYPHIELLNLEQLRAFEHLLILVPHKQFQELTARSAMSLPVTVAEVSV